MTSSARATLSAIGHCAASRARASSSDAPSRAITRRNCSSGGQATTSTRSKSSSCPVSKSSGMSATRAASRASDSSHRRSLRRRPDGRSPRDRHGRCESAKTIAAERPPVERAVSRREHPRQTGRRPPRRPAVPGATTSRRQHVCIDCGNRTRLRARRSTRALAGGDAAGQRERGPSGPRLGAAVDGVLEQQRDGQRSDAARHGRQRAGDPATAGCTSPTTTAPRLAKSARRVDPSGKSAATSAASVTRLMPTSITVAPGFT